MNRCQKIEAALAWIGLALSLFYIVAVIGKDLIAP